MAFAISLSVLFVIATCTTFFSFNRIILYWGILITLLSSLSSYFGDTKASMLRLFLYHYSYLVFFMVIGTCLSLAPFVVFAPGFILLVFASHILENIRPELKNFAKMIVTAMIIARFITLSNSGNITSLLLYQFTGMTVGVVFPVLIFSCLPYVSRLLPDIPFNKYTYVRALRVSVAFVILLLGVKFISIYNFLWVAFSIIVVMQGALGVSVKKAVERLTGTMLGIVIGTLLAYYLPQHLWLYGLCAYLFLILGNVFVLTNYSVALGFYTLMLTMVYYLLHPSVTLSFYLSNRLLDTCLGILIAILCEALIFPKSYVKHYRKALSECYQKLSELILAVLTQKDFDRRGIDEAVEKLKTVTDQIRFEPVVLISKRRRFFLRLPNVVQKITRFLETLQAPGGKDWQKPEVDMMTQLAGIYRQLSEIDYDNKQKKQKALKTIAGALKEMMSLHRQSMNKDTMKLYRVTVNVVVSYDKKLTQGT